MQVDGRMRINMDTMNIFDLLICLSGIYMIYTAWIMKKTGKITTGVFISKDVDVDQIRDKEGFIKYMFGKVLFMGIATCIIGGVGMITARLNGSEYIMLIGVLCFMIILILFALATHKARKKFIE